MLCYLHCILAIFNAPFDVVGGGDFSFFVFMIIQMDVKEMRRWNSVVMISAVAIVVMSLTIWDLKESRISSFACGLFFFLSSSHRSQCGF